MALDNWELASNTTARMTNYLIPDNNSNVIFLISEFNPARGDGAGGAISAHDDIVWRNLHGGISIADVHDSTNEVRRPLPIVEQHRHWRNEQ